MDNEKVKIYNEIMEDIVDRTNGEWDKMGYTDKVITVSIMKELKNEMDRYLKEEYPIVKMWSSLSIEDIRLSCTEPDFNMDNIETLDKFNSVHNL